MAASQRMCFLVLLSALGLTSVEAVLSCPQVCECPEEGVVLCGNRGLLTWPVGVPLSVTRLDLSQNQLKEFIEVQKLSNLKYLDLTANGISDVTSLSSTSVTHLNLSSNLLTNDQGLLDRLPLLISLDLSKNRLSNWYSFIGTKPLLFLDISSNDIDAGVLQTLRLPHLETLNISNNRLLNLSPGLFQGTPSLREVIIKNCDVKYVDFQSFSGLTLLTLADLSDNTFSALDTETFAHLPNLKYIGLGQSKMLCDCRVYDLKKWILGRRLKTNAEVICYTPKPLIAYNILTVDMSQFCSRALETTTPKATLSCTAPGISLVNWTNNRHIWLRVNITTKVVVETHTIGSWSKATKVINGEFPFFLDLAKDNNYTVCAFMQDCIEEACINIDASKELILTPTAPDASASSIPITAIVVTVIVMILLYIPLFVLTHRLIFILNKKLKKRSRQQEAPRSDSLNAQYRPAPLNNNRLVDPNHFNRSYADVNSEDNIIRGKSAAELAHYQSRDDVNPPGPTYEELIPDSESTNSTNLIDLESRSSELVLNPDQLDDYKSPKTGLDRNPLFGNKYGTPHFNKYVPEEMKYPGNYEDIYEEPSN